MLSIIVPAYNEEEVVANTITEIKNTFRDYHHELIIVDDGSTDSTFEKASSICRDNIKIVRKQDNGGKGAALKYGFKHASGDLIAFLDADLEIHPSHILQFISQMKREKVDVVVGSKRHPDSIVDYPPDRAILSRGYQTIVKSLFSLDVKDTQPGVKLFKRKVLEYVLADIKSARYTTDLEILVNAHKKGFKISEAPIDLRFKRDYSRIGPKDIAEIFADTIDIFYRHRAHDSLSNIKIKTRRFNESKTLGSTLITTLIIFMLIFSGPAGAVGVTLSGITDFNEGNALTFDLTIALEYENERIPIDSVTIILENESGVVGEYALAADGTNLTTGIVAAMIYDHLDYNYGDMTGYENGYGYGFGYGYGYGYGARTHSYKYSVEITDARNLPPGNYYVYTKVETGSEVKPSFDSSVTSFSIHPLTAPDVTPPSITITNPVDDSSISLLNDSVSGSVTDNVGVSSGTLAVNDAVQHSWDYGDAFNKKVSYASEQWNTINITATDTSDNTRSKEIQVYVLSPVANITDLNVTANESTTVDTKNQTNTIIEFVPTSNAIVNITVQGSTNTSEVNASNFTSAYGLAPNEKSLDKFIKIDVSGVGMNETSNISWVMIKMYYSDADLDKNGDGDANDPGDINENDLKLYWYWKAEGKWMQLNKGSGLVDKSGPDVYDIGTDTDKNYMWANLSHFSVYGISGSVYGVSGTITTPAIGKTDHEITLVGIKVPGAVMPGETATLEITLESVGQEPNVKISLNLPWGTKEITTTLLPGMNKREISFTVPEDASAGDYTVNVKAIAWFGSDSRDATINVGGVVVTPAPVTPAPTTPAPVSPTPAITTPPPITPSPAPVIPIALRNMILAVLIFYVAAIAAYYRFVMKK